MNRLGTGKWPCSPSQTLLPHWSGHQEPFWGEATFPPLSTCRGCMPWLQKRLASQAGKLKAAPLPPADKRRDHTPASGSAPAPGLALWDTWTPRGLHHVATPPGAGAGGREGGTALAGAGGAGVTRQHISSWIPMWPGLRAWKSPWEGGEKLPLEGHHSHPAAPRVGADLQRNPLQVCKGGAEPPPRSSNGWGHGRQRRGQPHARGA